MAHRGPQRLATGLVLVLSSMLAGCGDEAGGGEDVVPATSDLPVSETASVYVGVDAETLDADIVHGPEDEPNAEVGPSPDTDISATDTAETGEALEDISEGASLAPTWWDCRQALVGGFLGDDLGAVCDILHTTAPEERIYGIRWVVLDEALDLEAWMAPRLAALNALFAPAGMSFASQSVVTVYGGKLKDVGTSDLWTLQDLTNDTAQLLGLEETEPQAVLDVLIDGLLEAGVASEAVANLTLETALEPQPYLRTVARARPEEIHVVVTPLLGGHSGGGLSSGPGPNPIGRTVSVINVRSADAVADVVLAHEMGHFFGLRHPHAKPEEPVAQPMYDFAAAIEGTPIEKNLVTVLEEHLGSDFSGGLGQLYAPYGASLGGVINPITEIRYAIAILWLAARQTFRIDETDGPVPFADLEEFIGTAVSGEPVFYKNWAGKGTPNNCKWSDDMAMFACELGHPPAVFPGDGPMLDGSIVFDDGQRFDVMTYIGKTLFDSQLLDWSTFAPQAIPVMHIHANTPVRLMLRNHALDEP